MPIEIIKETINAKTGLSAFTIAQGDKVSEEAVALFTFVSGSDTAITEATKEEIDGRVVLRLTDVIKLAASVTGSVTSVETELAHFYRAMINSVADANESATAYNNTLRVAATEPHSIDIRLELIAASSLTQYDADGQLVNPAKNVVTIPAHVIKNYTDVINRLAFFSYNYRFEGDLLVIDVVVPDNFFALPTAMADGLVAPMADYVRQFQLRINSELGYIVPERLQEVLNGSGGSVFTVPVFHSTPAEILDVVIDFFTCDDNAEHCPTVSRSDAEDSDKIWNIVFNTQDDFEGFFAEHQLGDLVRKIYSL